MFIHFVWIAEWCCGADTENAGVAARHWRVEDNHWFWTQLQQAHVTHMLIGIAHPHIDFVISCWRYRGTRELLSANTNQYYISEGLYHCVVWLNTTSARHVYKLSELTFIPARVVVIGNDWTYSGGMSVFCRTEATFSCTFILER